MMTGASLKGATASTVGRPAQASLLVSTSATTTYRRVTVDGVEVFYREAGPNDAPTIWSARVPLFLARVRYAHPVAGDALSSHSTGFPGFGQSDAPPPSSYAYTFDNLAKTINGLLEQVQINVHLHGGDHRGRLAFASCRRIRGGCRRLSFRTPTPMRKAWAPNGRASRDIGPIRKRILKYSCSSVSFTATEQRHTLGTSHPERYNPDAWTDEYAHLSRPGQREIQADLLYDYRTNVASYPAWQAWLREHKPLLLRRGRNDPSFIAPGAEGFRRDAPDAEIHLLDAGHFALDDSNDDIAVDFSTFLAKHSL